MSMNASTFEQDEGVMLMSSNAQAYKNMLVSNVMQVDINMSTNISTQVVMLVEIMSLTTLLITKHSHKSLSNPHVHSISN